MLDAGKEILPKAKRKAAEAVSAAYRKLEELVDSLSAVVKANKGGTNKDLTAFAVDLERLIKKWKR